MAYCLFTPGNPEQSQSSNIELVGSTPNSAQDERYMLVEKAIADFRNGEMSPKAIDELWQADSKNLPVNFLSRLQDHERSLVLHALTGLAMSELPEHETFTVDSYEIDSEVLEDVRSDPWLYVSCVQESLSHYGWQGEPLETGEVRLHRSIGYKNEEDEYVPVATLLDDQHPLRQRITEARNQAELGVF